MNEAISALRRVEDEIRQRLLLHPDYRALLAVQEAIEKLLPPDMLESEDDGRDRAMRNYVVHVPSSGRIVFGPGTGRNTASAVESIMLARQRPTSAQMLRSLLASQGVAVTPASLSSILSRDERFRLVDYGGAKRWWLTNVPYQHPLMGVEQEEADDD